MVGSATDRRREERSEYRPQAHDLPAQNVTRRQAEGRGRSFRLRLRGVEADPRAVLAVDTTTDHKRGCTCDQLFQATEIRLTSRRAGLHAYHDQAGCW